MAELVVASLRAGGVLQAFGTGHSEALAMEFAGRAGGLVPTNRISLRDVVIFGGEPPDVLGDGHLERAHLVRPPRVKRVVEPTHLEGRLRHRSAHCAPKSVSGPSKSGNACCAST